NRGLDVRFRNFGWEGDTVYTQPRDVGFPSLKEHLRRAGVSVIALQFGRSEALSGRGGLAAFVSDYQKLLDECARQTPRLALVTPPPFEKGGGWLPDLSARKADLARAFARQLGFENVADAAGAADEQGVWSNAAFERLRQVVVAKNQLWFNYWRPQNWAFLGGDRTEQPSSRDYRNPAIRWFPAEMEKFVPLIEAKEREIAELVNKLP